MRTLTTEQISRMRSTVADNFTSIADVVRPSAAINGRGGASITTSLVARVACRIVESKTPDERMSGQQLKAFSGYIVYVPVGTDVKPKDQIVSGSLTLEVLDAIDAPSTILALAVYAVRVRA